MQGLDALLNQPRPRTVNKPLLGQQKALKRFWKAIQPTHQSTTIEELPKRLIFSCGLVLQ
ncbi:Hypothetical protein P9303_03751 [Prochlorococcus marinus str. MIT 9303]|uniref:Uncharacterized protein n=1 Tax=Prochlorococcus marinus (strain MIT 9303) TaxID=59922 RepID=A2C6L7_PROM3|nr:Hypothetical protein P9303_03751 [Prochlorococcus marinus str. MIT 9303]